MQPATTYAEPEEATLEPTPKKMKSRPFKKPIVNLDAHPELEDKIPVQEGIQFVQRGQLFEITRVRQNGKITVHNRTTKQKVTMRPKPK